MESHARAGQTNPRAWSSFPVWALIIFRQYEAEKMEPAQALHTIRQPPPSLIDPLRIIYFSSFFILKAAANPHVQVVVGCSLPYPLNLSGQLPHLYQAGPQLIIQDINRNEFPFILKTAFLPEVPQRAKRNLHLPVNKTYHETSILAHNWGIERQLISQKGYFPTGDT